MDSVGPEGIFAASGVSSLRGRDQPCNLKTGRIALIAEQIGIKNAEVSSGRTDAGCWLISA